MKPAIAFALALCFCFAPISPARALYYNKYFQFIEESSDFVEADERLTAIWEQVKYTVPLDLYEAVLKEQIRWNSRRDDEIEAMYAVAGGDLSLADICAIHTNRRADELESRSYAARSQSTQTTRDFTGTWHIEGTNTKTTSQDLYLGELTISTQSEAFFQFAYRRTPHVRMNFLDDEATIISSNEAIYATPDYDCISIVKFKISNNVLKISTDDPSCIGLLYRINMDGTYKKQARKQK